MINKFEYIPELSETDPRFRLMTAWADVNSVLGSEPATLHDAYELNEQIMLERNDPDLGSVGAYDRAIESARPELAYGLDMFRQAVNEMRGWPITYKQYLGSTGVLTITSGDREQIRLEDIWITYDGDWWPYDGLIDHAYVGPSTAKLGGMCIGLAIIGKKDDQNDYYRALNSVHYIRIYEPGESYVLDDSPADRMRELYGLDTDGE